MPCSYLNVFGLCWLYTLIALAVAEPCFTSSGRKVVAQNFNLSLDYDDIQPCVYIAPVNYSSFEDDSIEQVLVLRLKPCHENMGHHHYDFDSDYNFEYSEYQDNQFEWMRSDAWQEPFRARGLIADCDPQENSTATINPENSTSEFEWSLRSIDGDDGIANRNPKNVTLINLSGRSLEIATTHSLTHGWHSSMVKDSLSTDPTAEEINIRSHRAVLTTELPVTEVTETEQHIYPRFLPSSSFDLNELPTQETHLNRQKHLAAEWEENTEGLQLFSTIADPDITNPTTNVSSAEDQHNSKRNSSIKSIANFVHRYLLPPRFT